MPHGTDHLSRFDLSPPRHFLFPALLLLLAEEPDHGYRLVQRARSLRFGPVDRPSVYRALGQLEADRLVAVTTTEKTGRELRVYELTDEGRLALRTWMGVIKEDRDCLDRVLRRYAAGNSADAVLSQVVGGSPAMTGPAWSSVSPTSERDGHFGLARAGVASGNGGPLVRESLETERRRFRVRPDRSAVLIEARSTVGPINFGAIGVSGWVECDVRGNEILADSNPGARVEVPIGDLRSGNHLYDAELLRRLNVRRFPTVTLEMQDCAPLAPHRFRVRGVAGLHGVSKPLEGTVVVSHDSDGNLAVNGEQMIDMRDFNIISPTVLMLRIYPDVRVSLQLEAEPDT